MIVTYLESGLGVNWLTHRDDVCGRVVHPGIILVHPLKARSDEIHHMGFLRVVAK